jgi:glucosylglycerate hydrolase
VPPARTLVAMEERRTRPSARATTWTEVAGAAEGVLRRNDLGTVVAAAPRLYPHQWSWDAAFISIGLARMSVARAVTELRSVLEAQWSTGMIPHIRFTSGTDYFPGPEVWGTDDVPGKPSGIQTSGICQPPVHAIALLRILEIAEAVGGEDAELARGFAGEALPRLAAWHRWLATVRTPDALDPEVGEKQPGAGLVQIHHGWESGMDNSPRWDAAYEAVVPDQAVELRRHDTAVVKDATERPTDREYLRYLHLVAQLRAVQYDDARAADVVDFRMGDVFMTALLARAADSLVEVARLAGRGTEDAAALSAEQTGIADRARRAVLASVGPERGLCRDWDARTRTWSEVKSLASFSVLLCGGDERITKRQKEILAGPDWAAHPALRFALPPSLSPGDPGFRPRTYWRGPVWPVTSWLFWWAVRLGGDDALAQQWRAQSLQQLGDLRFGEYYDAVTGEPAGSDDQSWTAAVALDWAADD